MISREFDISHIDLMSLKINYPCINTLKNEVYPYREIGERAQTYIFDGRIIFACGMKLDRQGVGRCWVIPTIYVDKHKIAMVKTIKKLLEDSAREMELHRVHTTIVTSFVKWIELMGFTREATLKQISHDKSDEYLYVRFF